VHYAGLVGAEPEAVIARKRKDEPESASRPEHDRCGDLDGGGDGDIRLDVVRLSG
jgi:hypothetical protein